MIGVAETALLVPVAAAEPLVRKHRRATDPVAPLGVPAHVTVLYPFVPPDDVDQSVCDGITEVLEDVEPFDFTLTGVDQFPDGVLYLTPEPTEPFAAITRALTAAWPAYPPYHGAYDEIIPHLSVAMANGSSAAQLEKTLNGGLPLSTRADVVWLMEGQPDARWAIRAVFPLSASRT